MLPIHALVLAGVSVPPVSVQLHDQEVSRASFTTATATYAIASSGSVTSSDGTLESWLLGGGTASNYEVLASIVSGSLNGGTTGSWLNCGTTRTWVVSNGAHNNSVVTCVLSVQIRDVATSTVQASATITLSAESDNFN